MITEVQLREMRKDDLEIVNYIRNHDSTRFYLRNTSKIPLSDTESWFDEQKPRWFIILVNEEIVGYIRTSQDTGESICIGCDVHPERRGLGIAKKAYEKVINRLYDEGYLLLWLEVFSSNSIAINLYKNLGFQEVGERSVKDRRAIIMVHSKMSKNE